MIFLSYFLCLLNAFGSFDNNFWTYPSFAKEANIQDESLYIEASEDRVKFWETCAREIDWFEHWSQSFSWDCPYSKWYLNGKLNISYNCLDRHLEKNGDKIAFIWCNENGEERRVSYREMHQEVCKLANGLKSLGVEKGDLVAIYMPMTLEGIASMLACSRIGAVHSVIFGGTGFGSVREKINDSRAKIVVTADVTYRRGRCIPLLDKIDRILNQCPSVENVVVLQRGEKVGELKNSRYVDYRELVSKMDSTCPPEVLDSEDRLFVLYTSGTTGKPKGIIHTTGGYLVGVHNTFKWVFDYKPADVFWCTADIGWITGHSYVVYGPMSNGATQVIYEGAFDYPQKNQAWKIIEKYQVSTFYTAPTLIRTFMKWGPKWKHGCDLSSLRLLGSIGEPLNPEAWHWFHENIGRSRCPIVDTWFQTETGAFVISPIPGLTPLKPGSVSTPLPGFELAILNDNCERVEHGFLAITSPFPSMMRGVLNDPDRYYNTYWAKWNGRYYYAGDDAEVDKDQYYWVRGRADEVIKVSGHRVGTAELENIIIDVPGVSESAIVGLPDEIRGQKIVAFVVLKEGIEDNKELKSLITSHVGENVGKYAIPDTVEFVSDLPKTRSGKILRRVIADLIQGKKTGDISTLSNPESIDELKAKCEVLKNDGTNHLSLCATLDFSIEEPILAPSKYVYMSVSEIVDQVRPVLRKRIASTNYDRIFPMLQFLEHYENLKKTKEFFSPIQAFESFLFSPVLPENRGGPCVSLALDLLDALPKKIKAYLGMAKLPNKFQQFGFPNYCHVAVFIKYIDPTNNDMKGLVLLDPSFDICEPIVLTENGEPYYFETKKNGIWKFYLSGDRVICEISNESLADNTMVYLTNRILNPIESCAMPMICSDRKLSFLSRDEEGRKLAHLNVELNKNRVIWDQNGERFEPVTFQQILDGWIFPSSFAHALFLTPLELQDKLLKIIKNKEILDSLYFDYMGLIKTTNDFSVTGYLDFEKFELQKLSSTSEKLQ